MEPATPTKAAAQTRNELFEEFFNSLPVHQLAVTAPAGFIGWAISKKKRLPAACRSSHGVQTWREYRSPQCTIPKKNLSSAYYAARKSFLVAKGFPLPKA